MQISSSTYKAAATAASSTSGTVQGTASGSAGTSNDFMSILLAQMTHQNPMEPMKDSEMMSQYASLNTVQELKSIRSAITAMGQGSQIGYAASLIGKVATVNKTNGDQLNGLVKAVTIENGQILVQIGEEKAPLENVTIIKGAA